MKTAPLTPTFELGQNILSGEVLLPRLILKESALMHNIRRMADYCRTWDLLLAPHAKTTMAPGVIKRQCEAGVWGFTVATILQAKVLRSLGVGRILIANQLVEHLAISWLSSEMSAHPEFDVYILADSVTGVSILNESLGRNRVTRPIKVLLELGEAGARAGCRTIDEAIAVADAIGESEHLRLAGVEGFEALMDGDDVRAFLGRLRETTTVLASRGCFDGAQEIIISAGSSELIEITAKELSGLALALPTRTVLRPGGYATNSIMTGYRKSMEIVGAVISRPEDGVAIANFGRRDVPCDEKLLSPLAAVTQGHVRTIENHAKVVCLYDQHATLAVDGAELSVGDYIIVSVTSPYRPAFATWRTIPLVDDSYNIIENLDVLY